MRVQYIFDVAETEEFIVKEKFITFSQDYQLLSKVSLEEKSTVSITTPGIIVLILTVVSRMLSKIARRS